MRPSHLHIFLCLGLLVVAVWGVGVLQAGGAYATATDRSAARDECPPPKKDKDKEPPTKGPVQVSFCYHDFTRSLHKFTCTMDGSFDHQEETSFGYPVNPEAIWQELDGRLTAEIKKRAGDLGRYAELRVFHIANKSKPLVWDWKLAERDWAAERPTKAKLPANREKEAQEVEGWIQKTLPGLADQLYRGYFRQKGFEYTPDQGDSVNVAYKFLADKARQPLSDCFDKFVREAGTEDEEETGNLLLAAFQEMHFEFPPIQELVENEMLFRSGFWVPTEVLRLRRGDCDSKSAALCALWQHHHPQIALFIEKVPEEVKQSLPPEMRADAHALLGIEAVPTLYQASEPIGLRRYVLCEVVRQEGLEMEKLHRGQELFHGDFVNWFCMTDDCTGYGNPVQALGAGYPPSGNTTSNHAPPFARFPALTTPP